MHLREVIESEAGAHQTRLTNVAPWPPNALAKAYSRVESDWEHVEAAATAAQGPPSWDD